MEGTSVGLRRWCRMHSPRQGAGRRAPCARGGARALRKAAPALLGALLAWGPGSSASAGGGPGILRARIERLATLGWHLPYCPAGGSPWSPAGSLLAVDSCGKLAVFDAAHPEDPPRLLLARECPANITVAWSPDGRWVLCKAKYKRPGRGRVGSIADSLWAVSTEDGSSALMADGAEVWPFLWASDGFVYGWEGPRVRRYAPPARWRARFAGASRATPRIAFVPEQGFVRIVPGDPPEIARLPQLGRALQFGSFPDGGRFLLTRVEPGEGASNVVIDETGAVLAELDGEALEDSSGTALTWFAAKSVTADGRFVAGFYEIDRGEDIAKAVVFLTDPAGRSRIPVDGACYSTEVECSPGGPWIALQCLRGGLEVGTLELPR